MIIPQDLSSLLHAPFPIYSMEESDKFLSLSSRKFITSHYFNDDMFACFGIGIKIGRLSAKLRMAKFVNVIYHPIRP